MARNANKEHDVRSALNIVAFANASKDEGIVALLETALTAIDTTDQNLAGAYVQMALQVLLHQADELSADTFSGITECG